MLKIHRNKSYLRSEMRSDSFKETNKGQAYGF